MEKIKLDLIPSGKMPSLHASQYDDGREHGIDLFENGIAYKLDGTETLTINERKGDDCICSLDIENTFAGSNHIVFASTEQMCAVWGNNICELVIKRGSVTLGTLNFILEIEPSPTEGGITSQSEINNLARQVHDIVVEELEDNGAEETGYDNSESGLEATNVQDAIDEVNTKIENIPSVDAYTKEESNDKFATKTALNDVSGAVNDLTTALNGKADKDTTYTKTQVDSEISRLDGLLDAKADKSTTYTKTQVDNLISNIIQPIELSSIDDTMFDYVGNYYVATNGDKTELSGYYAFQIVAPCDFKVAVPDNLNNNTDDPILAVFNNGEWSRANFVSPRYRYPNLPTSSNMLSVNEGQLFVICLYNRQNFILPVDDFITDDNELNENLYLNNKQINQVKNRVSVSIVSQDKYTIKFGKMQLNFEHEVDTPTNKDLWTIRGVNCGDNVICNRGTDIIGVLREVGQTDFMGGLHGDEHVINMNIYGDSVPITSDGNFETVEILMFSHLYRPSDNTNVIDRVVNIVITANCIEITTTFKCLVDNFQLDYAYNGGMFAWIDTDASFQMSNIGIIESNGGTTNRTLQANKKLVSTSASVGGCIVTVENLIGHEQSNFLGEVYYYGRSDKRIKTYFSTDHNSTWNTNHISTGKFRFLFS